MPNRFVPIGAGSDFSQALPAINSAFSELDQETVTKVFYQPNGYAVIQGKLPYSGGYGTMYYDSNAVPIGIIGILPDGTTGFVFTEDGSSVLDVFV